MQIQIHGKPSFSKDGRKAQVVVLIGGKSITRHAERRFLGGPRSTGYFGLNIDERAVPLNERYEAEYKAAERELDVAEAALTLAERELDQAKNAVIVTEESVIAELVAAVETATAACKKADEKLGDAGTKLDIVQRELPLEVQFIGDDL
jgi:hypothetical protein